MAGAIGTVGDSIIQSVLQSQPDPRDERLEDMERMVVSYQEKLDNVTSNYQEKVAILENRWVQSLLLRLVMGGGQSKSICNDM